MMPLLVVPCAADLREIPTVRVDLPHRRGGGAVPTLDLAERGLDLGEADVGELHHAAGDGQVPVAQAQPGARAVPVRVGVVVGEAAGEDGEDEVPPPGGLVGGAEVTSCREGESAVPGGVGVPHDVLQPLAAGIDRLRAVLQLLAENVGELRPQLRLGCRHAVAPALMARSSSPTKEVLSRVLSSGRSGWWPLSRACP